MVDSPGFKAAKAPGVSDNLLGSALVTSTGEAGSATKKAT